MSRMAQDPTDPVDKFLTDNEGNPAIEGNIAILESIKVLAKIVVDDPSSVFVTNVTICNNRQNPVEPWNLRANDRIQCDLHDKLREVAYDAIGLPEIRRAAEGRVHSSV